MKVIRKYFVFLVIAILLLFSLAFQVEDTNPWRGIFEWTIGIVLMLLGAPITQWLKNKLGIQDKLALLLTGLVAVVIAIAELFLANVLSFESFTLENFPLAFSAVMTVATFYYHLLKNTDTVLGSKLLLPKPSKRSQ